MASGRRQYPFHLIEPKWQRQWDQRGTFRAWNPGESVPAGHPFAERHAAARPEQLPKFYILDMFPYPSGAGLHVGHPEGYTATDILARYRRALGYNVLHPIGWDAFGLPAEQYAIKTRQHPRKTTEQNIATFKRQIKSLGFSYDWSREVDTTDPEYFKWTQWIFLQLYNAWFNPQANKAEPISTLPYPPELQSGAGVPPAGSPGVPPEELEQKRRAYRDSKRLAYVAEAPVWWCEQLGTVLANEEVVDGKSEVGGFPVARKPMRQWMLRITAYAERLLQDLETIQWSDSLKEMQRNWIGRSEGAEVDFAIAECGTRSAECQKAIRVFTTRPDTLFGATYMVLAPEHKLVDALTTPTQRQAVEAYKAEVAKKSDLERTELAKEKTGVFTGGYAMNPVNGEKIPIWIADYVLSSYGTGAIMAVPAHDQRDYLFAKKFGLPIRQVVLPQKNLDEVSKTEIDKLLNKDPETVINEVVFVVERLQWVVGASGKSFEDDGIAVASAFLDGLPTPEAKRKVTVWLESRQLGKKTINYKLRDWLFSRQRYWGEPFPIIWKTGLDGQPYHEALPQSALPLLPPPLDDYKPTPDGQPPLARAKEWVKLPDGSMRETNTMPQWAGSCWYYLRYLDTRNDRAFCSPEAEHYWMGALAPRTTHNATKLTPGVDLYVGGTEHAVLHLLYARFWHKVLFDLCYVSTPEPFFKLVNQGLILGEVEYLLFCRVDAEGHSSDVSVDELVKITPMSAGKAKAAAHHRGDPNGDVILGFPVNEEEVERTEAGFVLKRNRAIRVHAQCFKMSKSRGNVINPDDILVEYGADAFRLYEMFMGPLEMVKPWSTKGVEGVYRFLGRVWRLFVDEQSETEFEQSLTADPERGGELLSNIRLSSSIKDTKPTAAQLKVLHACIKKVTEDLDGLRFNTGISALMVFINEAIDWETKPVAVLRDFLILLQPFAPHLAEELWSKLHASANTQHVTALAYAAWPQFDPALLVEDVLEVPVQVNGKLRDVIKVPASASAAELEAAAKASEKVKPFLEGKTIRKVIVLPKRLVNIVVG